MYSGRRVPSSAFMSAVARCADGRYEMAGISLHRDVLFRPQGRQSKGEQMKLNAATTRTDEIIERFRGLVFVFADKFQFYDR